MAQALKIVPGSKHSPVALVVNDVVNIGGQCAIAAPCTLPTERLPQELLWTQVILPDRQVVPAMPRCSRRTALVTIFGPVHLTVALTD